MRNKVFFPVLKNGTNSEGQGSNTDNLSFYVSITLVTTMQVAT